MVGVGAVGALHADADLTRGLDGLQQVGGALRGACAGAVTAGACGEQAGGSGEGCAQQQGASVQHGGSVENGHSWFLNLR